MGLGAALISSLSVAAVMHMTNTSIKTNEPLGPKIDIDSNKTKAPVINIEAEAPAGNIEAESPTIMETIVETNEAAGNAAPHLVMMVIDDLGWTDVGFHRTGSNFHTPVMDHLATTGVILDKYYVQQVCSPTRSALMTARYPFRIGLQHTTTLAPGSRAAIPKDTATIAEVLKASGYATHAVGKWHLGFQGWDDTPIGRGFDSHAGYLNGAIDYYSHEFGFQMLAPGHNGTTSKSGLDLWRNKTAAWDYDGKHSTGFYMEEATRVIHNHNPTTPMFLYFAHQLVHEPLQVPTSSVAMQRCADVNTTSPIGAGATVARHTLCTMASAVDTAIGELVEMLKAKGMWENTVLWLTTDNGGMTHGAKADRIGAWSASSNWPLRGGKATLFEGGVRGVSFVAGGRLPDSARGKVRTELMQHVDIPATMAKLAGAKWTRGTPDGVDVWDAVVKGSPSTRTEVPINVDTCVGVTGGPPCHTSGTKYNALIRSNWKLIEANWVLATCPNSTWCTGAGMYDGWWTNDPYSHIPPKVATQGPFPASDVSKGGLWLFDLSADPNEETNVAASNPDVVAVMRKRLAELAEVKNGYRHPQLNIPNPRCLPVLHNETWAPFRTFGEALPPLPLAYVEAAVASLAKEWWD